MDAELAEHLAAVLNERYPVDLVRDRGEVVGAWYVAPGDFGSGQTWLAVAFRDRAGRPVWCCRKMAGGRDPARLVERMLPLWRASRPRYKGAGYVAAVMLAILRTSPGSGDGWRNGWAMVPSGSSEWSRIADVKRDLISHCEERRHVRALDRGESPGSPDASPQEIECVREALANQAHAMLGPFLATIDPGIRAVAERLCDAPMSMKTTMGEWFDDAAWAGLDPACGASGVLMRALLAHPAHDDLVLMAWQRHKHLFGGDAVPPLATLAALFPFWSIPPHVAEGFRRRWPAGAPSWPPDADVDMFRCETSERVMSFERGATGAMLLLARLPPSWVPRDVEGWSAYADLYPALSLGLRNSGAVDVPGFVNAKGDWCALAIRLAKATGRPDGNVLMAVEDGVDMLAAFGRQVVMPALAMVHQRRTHACAFDVLDGAVMPPSAGEALVSRRSLVRYLEMSATWHVRRERMAKVVGDAGAVEWERGLPDADYGDVLVRVLCSSRDLDEEGARSPDSDGVPGLGHCVGDYVDSCVSGTSRIVSIRIRDPDGTVRRLSTVQVAMAVSPVDLGVVQHRGRGNGFPERVAVEALDRYMRDLREGRLPYRPVPRLPSASGDVDTLRPGPALALGIEAWGNLMGRDMRTWSAARIAEASGLASPLRFPAFRRAWAALVRRLLTLPPGRA